MSEAATSGLRGTGKLRFSNARRSHWQFAIAQCRKEDVVVADHYLDVDLCSVIPGRTHRIEQIYHLLGNHHASGPGEETHQAIMATVGAGSGAHVCGIYFEQKTGSRVRYVPYKGAAPVMTDLMANEVDLFCGEASQMLEHFRAGRIKPLIVMSKNRWRPMPDIPTVEELGAADTYIAFWHGLWVPKGTPKNVIARLNDAVVKAFADPVVTKRLTDLGQDLPTREQMNPQALGAFHKSEIAKWWPLIKAANIKAE